MIKNCLRYGANLFLQIGFLEGLKRFFFTATCKLQTSLRENDIDINSEINQMRLVKNKQIIPAPEPDSNPDSSSPDSSSPEAGSFPDESSPEADSIPDKVGKIK